MAMGNFVSFFLQGSFIPFAAIYSVAIGFGGGMIYMSVYVLVGVYFERWRGLAISIISCGSSVGTIIMPMIYGTIKHKVANWRYLFIFNGVILTMCSLLSFLLRPLKPTIMSTSELTPPEPPKKAVPVKKQKEKKVKVKTPKSPKATSSFVTLKNEGEMESTSSATSMFMRLEDAQEAKEPDEPTIIVRSSSSIEEAAAEGVGARPMYREDIFYAASSARLGFQATSRTSGGYSVAVLPTVEDVEEERRHRRERCPCDCACCPPGVRRVLANLLGASLMKSPVFLGILLTQTVCMIGYHAPFYYVYTRASEHHMSTKYSYWLLPLIGIANTLGRILCGVIVELPHVSALHLTNVSYIIAGFSSIISCFSIHYIAQFAYVFVFGMMVAAFVSMKSIILVDYIGLERLTNAFGLLLMFQGIAALIGPPIAGYSAEAAHDINVAFFVSGSISIVGGLLGYLLSPLKRVEERQRIKKLRTQMKKRSE